MLLTVVTALWPHVDRMCSIRLLWLLSEFEYVAQELRGFGGATNKAPCGGPFLLANMTEFGKVFLACPRASLCAPVPRCTHPCLAVCPRA